MVCECVGQLDMIVEDGREGCLHCGRPTPLGKWRCEECQGRLDTHAAVEVMRAARVEASRERWADVG